LVTIPPHHAEAANLVYRRRHPLRFRLLGRAVAVAAKWRPSAEPDADIDRHVARIGIDDQIGELLLPTPLLNFVLGGMDWSLAMETISSEQAIFALELALSEILDALEARAGCRWSLLSIAPAGIGAAPRAVTALCFAVEIEGVGRWGCSLEIGPAEASRLAQQLDENAGIDRVALEDFPIPVRLRLAASNPTSRELSGVGCGDVILFDDACRRPREAIAVVAEHLVALVALDPGGARLFARPVRVRSSPWEWSMDKQDDAAMEAEVSDTDLDDIPVRVVFEVGRLDLPLGEVQRLTAGALIPLDRFAENAVEIMAHGRRLGRGTLIKIGDSLGVRVIRLFNHD
jgi:type III secretion protein Q